MTTNRRSLFAHLRRLTRPSVPLSDQELLQRFTESRDEEAFTFLVERHGPMVLRVCQRVLHNHHDAEEVFQATFLVLARKAAGLAWQASVGSWLYQVAYRLSLKARTMYARRRRREEQATPRPDPDPLAEITVREAIQVLDEEIHRLGEKYQAPLVLVLLEGTTQEEAARQLGWSLSTLKRRLERGRTILQHRLTRRGLSLAAGLAAACVGTSAVSAGMPQSLLTITVRAALAGANASLAAPVAYLLQRGLAAIFWMRMQTALALFTVVGLLATGTGLTVRHFAANQPSTEPPEKTPAPLRADVAETRTDPFGDPLPPHALARLGTVRFRHESTPRAAIFSQDGQTLISGARDSVWLWDAATGQPRGRLKESIYTPLSLSLAADGKTLAAGGVNGIFLWDLPTRKLLRHWRPPGGWTEIVAFSPDQKTLATVTDSDRIHLWNPANGQEVRTLAGHQGLVNCFVYLPDGTLISGGDDGTVRLWDPATGREIRQFGKSSRTPSSSASHNGRRWLPEQVVGIALTPDGKRLAVVRYQQPITFWDVATGRKAVSLASQKGGMGGLAYSPDGKLLATGVFYEPIRLWDASTGKLVRALEGSPGGYVLFAPDGKTLVSWDRQHTFRFWDVATGKPRENIPGPPAAVMGMALSPDGNYVASTSWWERQVRLWDPRTGKERTAFTGQSIPVSPLMRVLGRGTPSSLPGVYGAAFSPDSQTLAFATDDAAIHLVRIADGRERLGFHTYQARILVLAYSPDGKLLATANENGTISLWDSATGAERRRLSGHAQYASHLAFTSDSRRLISADGGGSIRLWNVETGRQLYAVQEGNTPVMGLALSPDDRTLAISVFSENRVQLRDAVTGASLRTIELPSSQPSGLSFSPDGRLLALTNESGEVRLIELVTGKERQRFAGHLAELSALAFARDGRWLATASYDTTLLTWDVAGVLGRGNRTAAELSPTALETTWMQLGDEDAMSAYHGMEQLLGRPQQAVRFLQDKLRPVAVLTESQRRQTTELVSHLDSDQFAVRQKAEDELRQLGESALPALREALQRPAALETRRRLERIMENYRGPNQQRLRVMRAVEVLERLHTSGSQDVLKILAQGEIAALVTQEARAALRRQGVK